MITDKLIKEWHAKEIMWTPIWSKKAFHAVVLVDKKLGVSVKPYWIDEKEKQEAIWAKTEHYYGISEEMLSAFAEEFADPHFCFAHASRFVPIESIRTVLEEGHHNNVHASGHNAYCPFA